MDDQPTPDEDRDRTLHDAVAATEDARRRAAAARTAARRQDERWRGWATQQTRAHERGVAAAADREAELTRTLTALEQAASSLLDSRRWAIARQLGNLRDKVGRDREPGKEESRLRAALAAAADRARTGAAATADAEPAAPPPPPGGAEPAGLRAGFIDLDGYLTTATLDPLLPAPYDEPSRRVIGTMDSLRLTALRAVAGRTTWPRISVVLAAHGPDAGLAAAVASVRAQQLPDLELVVAGPKASVVAAAWDGPADALRVLPGAADDRDDAATARWADHRAALAAADGPLIAHLDAATVWEPDLLRVLVAAMEGHDSDRPRLAYAAQQLWHRPADAPDVADELIGIRFGPYHRALLENRAVTDLSTVVHDAALRDGLAPADPDVGDLGGWDLLLGLTAGATVTGVPCLLSRRDVTGRGGVGELTRNDELLDVPDDATPAPAVQALDRRHRGAPIDLPSVAAVIADPAPTALPPSLQRRGAPRPTSVVIPSYEAPDELRACLATLAAYSPADHLDVIVVDNDSGDGTQAVLSAAADAGAITLLRNERNLGFTAAVNRGIDAAGDRDVVLLNNDALVTPGWLEGLWAVLDAVPDAGLVVPRQVLGPQRSTRSHVPAADITREVDVNLSQVHDNVLPPDPTLPAGLAALRFAPFFAVYLPRATIDLLGPLNQEHGPHYRSDRLYCNTVRHGARRRIVYTPASKLYHLSQRATRTLRERDPARYEAMYVFNDWQRIQATTTEAAPAGTRPPS